MRMLYLYNTRSRTKEEFRPIQENKVGYYSCGPTVYNYVHIGNLRTYISVDVVRRSLEYLGYDVTHVMNITDVGHLTSDADLGDDKMLLAALREKKSVWDIAEYYTKSFLQNMTDLNIGSPTILCKATDHIAEQIALIQKLEEKGMTYRISDGIYFDTAKFPSYGEFARLNLAEQKAGARVEENPEKKNAHDFALWKFSPEESTRQMEWTSPWGVGFPGWHIECSAMATKYLGQPFDIHSGGIDHIPVHHTNEIAQSESAFDTPLAKYWLHMEFLVIESQKMAKSEGNFLTLASITERGFDPLAYRFFTYSAHYRQQLNFSWEALAAARAGLESLRSDVQTLFERMEPLTTESRMPQETILTAITDLKDGFRRALEDDINMPKALAAVFSFLRSVRDSAGALTSVDYAYAHAALIDCDRVLGLRLERIEQLEIPKNISNLIELRNQARLEKRWRDADLLRETIEAQGFAIEDTSEGTKVVRKR